MNSFLSDSAKRRLPSAIQKLSEKEQAVFVFLRMRKDEQHIARELGIPLSEAPDLITAVQSALAATGALDLISDPVFYPIGHPTHPGDDDQRPLELASNDIDMADRVALDQFYDILKKSIAQMPQEGRRLLGLWFNKGMPAKDILLFYNNIGADISNSKSIKDSTAQDVFYAVEKNIRILLDLVRNNMGERENELTPALLKEVLKETGL